MASQIYTRYIPPLKKTSNLNLPAVNLPAAAIIAERATPPTTRQDASSTYARHVPHSKTKAEQSPTSLIPAPKSTPTSKRDREEVGDEPVPKRTKKDEHEKKSRQARVPPQEVPESTKFITSLDHGGHASTTEVQETGGAMQSLEAGDPDDGHNTRRVKKHKPKKERKLSKKTPNADLQSAEKNRDGSATELEKRKPKMKRQKGEEETVDGASMVVAEEKEDSRHKKLMDKRQKSLKKAKNQTRTITEFTEEDIEAPAEEVHAEVHDLVPLPQPDSVPEPPNLPVELSLPPWLSSPIRVLPTASASFSEVGLEDDVAKVLQKRGFGEAFAVQAAVLPLLLPGKHQTPGDVLVSAATGSGKTLAYVLPMIENISRSQTTRLRGLIIMPTRELVTQAKEICETCASAFPGGSQRKRVKIGTAVGNEILKIEQDVLMTQELLYDPVEYEKQQLRVNSKWESSDFGSDEEILCGEEVMSTLPDHIFHPVSKVDILVCTPGRLAEHIKFTPGFTLAYMKWLVVDEADKLLGQSFQQWLEVVMQGVDKRGNSRDRVRKVVLSATMTRDVGLLNPLKLHRPKLVVLEGSTSTEESNRAQTHVIPSLLLESSVKVEDENIKPLYLMELLRREEVLSPAPLDDSSSASDSLEDEFSPDGGVLQISTLSFGEATLKAGSDTPPGVLIFTKSNESAVRLGRLIAFLSPSSARSVGTLTSTTPRATRKSTLRSFSAGKISILVASDLVSRGLDLPNLAYVINYDVPTSLTSYIHRIGRTARAGKGGHAWTLYTSTEGRWFWNEIGRNAAIERSGEKIERVNIKADIFDEQRSRYAEALATLGVETRTSKPNA